MARAVKLNTGHALPSIGLGVYRTEGNSTVDAVSTALRLGYRHVDTAQYYQNEGASKLPPASSRLRRRRAAD